jgi:hypothetical protein
MIRQLCQSGEMLCCLTLSEWSRAPIASAHPPVRIFPRHLEETIVFDCQLQQGGLLEMELESQQGGHHQMELESQQEGHLQTELEEHLEIAVEIAPQLAGFKTHVIVSFNIFNCTGSMTQRMAAGTRLAALSAFCPVMQT